MSGRPTRAAVGRWADEVEAVAERIGRRFSRSEPRRRAVGYVRALLSDAERKNGWRVAEHLGEATPDGVQHLLARADWDADAARDDLMGYVRDNLGDPDGVLVVDETGFLKKGTKSCGVARQYTGTAGRIENSQVGVFLAYAGGKGAALIDRALYLPKEWAGDPPRCRAAGVPEAVAFATKIVLAKRMVERAVAAGLPARWVTADAVYGSDYQFRAALESRGLGYVLAVRTDFAVTVGFRRPRAKALLAEVPADAWQRLSCGVGSKGPRWYDWVRTRINCPDPRRCQRWLLIRRSVSDPNDVSYFVCGGRPATPLAELVAVAGRRWAIEDLFELGQGRLRVGRVRGAELGWLAPARDLEPARPGGGGGDPLAGATGPAEKGGERLIPLSVPEVRKLLLRLVWVAVPEDEQVLAWSVWRRRHQHRARECHYRKRGARPPD